MINLPTFNASLTNQSVAVASMTNIDLPLFSSGLWGVSVLPWQLSSIWDFVNENKTNVTLTNL